jgi:hypothetical protein
VEWYQINQTHGFHVFDAIPLVPFQTLLWAVLPSAASTDIEVHLPVSMTCLCMYTYILKHKRQAINKAPTYWFCGDLRWLGRRRGGASVSCVYLTFTHTAT